jgi:protein tyrosine/serine phosphatase
LAAGRNVYVHCWGGSGRTGTVVGCWLRRHGLAEPEEVLGVLQELRGSGDRDGGHKDTPQTPDQRWMVESWEEDA